MATKRYFEFVEGSSSKFWEIWIDGNTVFTRYGKIGADGQTTMKDQGSAADAAKLHAKLVKEKTGKGYVEGTVGGGGGATSAAPAGGDYKAAWAALASAKDLPAALTAHFQFLADTPACKKLLEQLCARAKSATAGESLEIVFAGQDDGEQTLTCSAPYTGTLAKNVPKTYARFVRVHNGMSLETGDVGVGFCGVSDDGEVMSGGFESEYLEESEPELFEKLQEKELMIEAPIDYNQDWIVYNPTKKTKLGEPTLHYFSHEGGGLDSTMPLELGITGVWLRVMAQDLLGIEPFGDSSEDDGDDDEDGEEEGEGGDVRRFESTEDGASKFWEIRVEGASHTVRFGKIGTDGQSKTKEFDDVAAARKDADKLIAEKTKKGYEEV